MCECVENTVFVGDAKMAVQCRYWSMCVGFLYTVVTSDPLVPTNTKVSKRGRDPGCFWFSVVNDFTYNC